MQNIFEHIYAIGTFAGACAHSSKLKAMANKHKPAAVALALALLSCYLSRRRRRWVVRVQYAPSAVDTSYLM